MKALHRKRLQALEQARADGARIHVLWVEAGDSDADINEQRERLIADGKARATDRFVSIGWKND